MLNVTLLPSTATGVNPSMIETPAPGRWQTLFRLPETHLTLQRYASYCLTAENFQRAGYVHPTSPPPIINALCGMLISPCAVVHVARSRRQSQRRYAQTVVPRTAR